MHVRVCLQARFPAEGADRAGIYQGSVACARVCPDAVSRASELR